MMQEKKNHMLENKTNRHAQTSRLAVLELKVLVGKKAGADCGDGAGAVAVDEIAGFDQAVLLRDDGQYELFVRFSRCSIFTIA